MLSRTLLITGVVAAACLTMTERALADNGPDTRGLGAAVSSAHTISGTRRALVVGISEYENLPVSQQLRYADDDAEMVYAFLRSDAGGPTEYATLLRDEQATAGAIMQELYTIRDQTQPGDEIIFYFAGHGDVENIGGDVSRGRLLAHDAPPDQLYIGMGGTIPVQTVQDIMEVIVEKGAQVIILTDACRSGSMNSGLEGAQVTAAKLAGTWSNVFRFVSSSANQLSEEDADLGHGVFTYYLLDGLLGAADGLIEADGVVDATEINLYVTQQVRRRTDHQTPVLTGDPGRVLSTVSSAVTWATLEQLVPPREETPQYVADRGLAPEEREARLESLTSDQRGAIEQFEDRLNSGNLIGDGGAAELYETLRNRVPNSYFSQLGQQLAVALEVQVQGFFSRHLRVSFESDRELLTEAQVEESSGAARSNGERSIWDVPLDQITAAADAMEAALALRGATYINYPTMRSQAQFLGGWAAVVEGDYEEGIERLREVTPQSAFSLNALGYAYYHNNQPDEAADALARSVALAPNWAEPRRFQGFVAQYRGDFEAALGFYEAAAAVAPENPFLQADIGEIHARMNDLDAAMTAWRKALDINAEAAAPEIANFIMYRLRAADRMELADSIYAEALLRAPDSASLHVDRGDLYSYFDRFDDAEADYNQALRIDSGYAFAHNGLGLLFEFQQRYDEAEEAYRRTAELMPDSPIPWRNLADVYRAQERYQDAIGSYERALAADPDYSAAHMGLGKVYTDLENFDEAERHLRLYAEMSNNGGAWNDLGVFYEIHLNQYESAMSAYEQARDVSPEDARILANLGDARRKLNRHYEAAGSYREALRFNPAEQLAINGLELLEDHGIVPRRDRTVERYPGRLDASAATLDDGSYYVPHAIYGDAGEEWTVLLQSEAFDPYLMIRDDGGGGVLAEDDDSGPGYDASLTVTLPHAGQYTIIANTYSEGEYGNYEIVMLRERPEGQGFGEAQVFTGELTARSEELDDGQRVEVHYISATAGEQLEITAASDEFDTRLFVFSGGDLIAEDDDSAGGTNSRVVLSAPATGEYMLAITSYEAGSFGEYRVAVRRGTGQAAAPAGAAAAAGETDVIYGTLSSSSARLDSDKSPYEAHEITARAGDAVDISMESSDFDTYLIVLDPSGNVLAEDDDSGTGTNSRITFTAATTGTYTIYANSYDATSYGAYTLYIRGGGRSGSAGGTGGAMAASMGATLDASDVVTGELTRANERIDDGPYFAIHRITASAGETLTFSLGSQAFDTYVAVYTFSGELIGEDDDSGGGASGTDSRVTVTAPSDGELLVFARGYGANDLGVYTLSVERGPQRDSL